MNPPAGAREKGAPQTPPAEQAETTRWRLERDPAFYKKLFRLALPVTLQSIITISVNMADTMMLGSFGESQLSASSLANQFLMLFHILCMGIGGGAAVMTAQYWGKKDLPSLKKIITIMLRATAGLSLVFVLAAALFPGAIMAVYTNEADLIANGILYYSFLAYSFPFTGLSATCTLVLRSFGAVRVPLVGTVVGMTTNVFLNWVLIFGNLGAPRMEIAGAALATLIARVVECAIILGYLLLVDRRVAYRLRDLAMKCGDKLREYLKYSVPVIISDALLALGNNAAAIIIGRLGASFVTANAITSLTVQITTVFGHGLASGGGILTGNAIGRGQLGRAYNQGGTMVLISGLLGAAASGVVLLVHPLVISFYNIQPETRAIADELILAIAVSTVFMCLSSVLTKGVLRGGGDTRFLMVADILFLWLASVPLGILAAWVLGLPPFWIYQALRIEMVIKTVWCLWRFKSRKWIKVIH